MSDSWLSTNWNRLLIASNIMFNFLPGVLYNQTKILLYRKIHQYTYTPPTDPFILLPQVPTIKPEDGPHSKTKNVVIVGASYAGYTLASSLAKAIPSGYRVVVVEKNDRFHHIFNFPRYSVLPPDPSHAIRAFMPYGPYLQGCPSGSVEFVRGEVFDSVSPKEDGGEGYVVLKTGEAIPWSYLVIATGSSGSWKVNTTDTEEACAELRERAIRGRDAKRIVIIGGGAIGVQLATDYKSQYGAEKEVTLIHSRERLLNRFGVKLHDAVMAQCEKLQIRVLLGVRAQSNNDPIDGQPGEVIISTTGEAIPYDLLIRCTGGNSKNATNPFRSILPESCFNPVDGRIITRPSLQSKEIDNVFALGDVCNPDIQAPVAQMGRAAFFQSQIVTENIVTSITNCLLPPHDPNREELKVYAPNISEDSIKLTVGIKDAVMWFQDGIRESTIAVKLRSVDLDAKMSWWMYANVKDYPKIEGE